MIAKDFWRMKVSAAVLELWETTAEDEAGCKVIIETTVGRADRMIAMIEGRQGKIHRQLGIIPSVAAQLPRAAIPDLAKWAGTKKIWRDTPVYAMSDSDGAPDLGRSAAQETGYTGKGVVVAVLDTGIFPHEDLTRPENRILAWCDLVNGELKPYDDNGHGTHAAGIIAGNGLRSGGRYRGMAPEARLVGVKILDAEGLGRLSDLMAGIEWCLVNQSTLNIRIMNLSLGTAAQADYFRDPLCRAVSNAVGHGVTVCAAADSCLYLNKQVDSPGISPKALIVGNSQIERTLNCDEFISNFGKATPSSRVIPDLVAAGTEVVSLDAGGGYCSLSGTSSSAPIVSGAAALMTQKRSDLGPERIKRLLKRTANDLGMGKELQGAGELDLVKLFGPPQRKRDLEAPRHSQNTELLKTIINLVGRNIAGGKSGDKDPIADMIMSILKGL